MIKRPIALVLGAGASKPYGFPIARELLTDIRDGLKNDTFRRRLLASGYGETEIRDLGVALAGSPVGSVDEFLEIPAHSRLVGVGKGAIAASLLPREQALKLLPDAQEDDWYEHLFRRMREDALSFDAFLQNGLRFVTFNYERSFEQFLVMALQRTYGLKPSEVAQAFKQGRIQLVHVYGSFGAIPDLGGDLSYGVETNFSGILLKRAAESIHIAGESGAQVGIAAAQSALMSCERICFLGFGYRTANVERLQLKTTLRKDTRVFGSAFGSRPGERGDIKRMFAAAGYQIRLARSEAAALDALRRLPVLSTFDIADL